MKNKLSDSVGAYGGDVYVAYSRARLTGSLVTLGWGGFPFLVETLLYHPGDMVRLQYILQGQYAPTRLTAQQLSSGFMTTLLALGVLVAFQLVCSIIFYRRAQLDGATTLATPPLWPVAGVLTGLVGNGLWYLGTGYVDPVGFIVGLSSIVLSVGCEIVVNNYAREFVELFA